LDQFFEGRPFEYTEQRKAKQNLHRELMTTLRRRDTPPQSRYGSSSKLSHRVKRAEERLLGRTDEDLYDLARWTVFNE
jgi:hypothetical protein